MKVKITADFSISDISKEIDEAMKLYLNDVVKVFSDAGKAMADDARERTKDVNAPGADSFGNITWELRSSIGCVVYRSGEKVFSYFPILATGAEGAKEGEDYADFIALQLTESDEIVLVVVAGKEYAAAVENKGYNVLSNTATGAEKILDRYIQAA